MSCIMIYSKICLISVEAMKNVYFLIAIIIFYLNKKYNFVDFNLINNINILIILIIYKLIKIPINL